MYRIGLLLGVVVLAGCLGGVTGSSGPPDAKWATGDSLNTTVLAQQHYATIRDAGSFTVNRSDTIRVRNVTTPENVLPEQYHPPMITRHRVDLADGRYLGASITVGDRRSAHFVTPDVTASRRQSCPDCEVKYNHDIRPEGDTLSERIQQFEGEKPVTRLARFLRGVTVRFNYTYTGTVTRNGETLYRYHAAKNLSRPTPLFSTPPRGNATILVTGEGVVRSFSLAYTGSITITSDDDKRTVTVTHEFSVTYSDIGTTTVKRPGWISHPANEESIRTTETDSE